jgi:hypothetical protein
MAQEAKAPMDAPLAELRVSMSGDDFTILAKM